MLEEEGSIRTSVRIDDLLEEERSIRTSVCTDYGTIHTSVGFDYSIFSSEFSGDCTVGRDP